MKLENSFYRARNNNSLDGRLTTVIFSPNDIHWVYHLPFSKLDEQTERGLDFYLGGFDKPENLKERAKSQKSFLRIHNVFDEIEDIPQLPGDILLLAMPINLTPNDVMEFPEINLYAQRYQAQQQRERMNNSFYLLHWN
ncbi:MAG: hypothetical protein U9Q06_03855 [Nanoarchaeota archaeon]|nr:hypothetical protein [Nanoarchaeota archaeon]